MTDRNELDELHQRAKTAAADLRAQAEARAVPPFDPEAPMRLATAATSVAPSRRPLFALAAVLALLVGGLAWWSGTRSEDSVQDRAVTTGGGAVRPYVATDLPDGFEPFGYTSLGQTSPDAESTGPLLVYGPSPDEPSLGVVYLPELNSSDIEGQEQIEIGDRTAYVFDDFGLGPNALMVGIEDGAVLVMSPVLDRNGLVEVIQGLSVDLDTDVSVAAGSLPSGWSQLASEPLGLGALMSGMNNGGGGPQGFSASYLDGDEGNDGVLNVLSGPGDAMTVSLVALTATTTETVTVRGHQARLATIAGSQQFGLASTRVLAWEERPGEVVRVIGSGVAVAELSLVAEGVEPIDLEAWATLEERSQLGEFYLDQPGDGSKYEELARGRFDDGTAWRLQVVEATSAGPEDADPGQGPPLIFDIALPISSESSSSGGTIEDDSLPVVLSQRMDDRQFGAALLGEAVASVELRLLDGTVAGRPEIVEGAGYRAWVAELPADSMRAVALDAAGNELGSATLGDGGAPEFGDGPPDVTVPVAPGDVPTTVGG